MRHDTFAVDPRNPGWIKGWAVLRTSPWDLVGMYVTETEAREACAVHPGYEVKFGSRKLGSNDFVAD